MSERETDIESSLQILLTTAMGERVMQPKYGCAMDEYLFESMNRTMKALVIDRIRSAILFFEPRIDAKEIVLDDSRQEEGLMMISVDYVVRSTNSRLNFVFPFYVREGTEIAFLTNPSIQNG